MHELLKKIFIYPLLSEKPEHMDERDFLAKICNVHSRAICVYRASKEFQILGEYMEGGVHMVPGWTGSRRIMKGDLIVGRKDFKEPFYDLEHEGRSFRLTLKQWAGIESVLKKTRGQDGLDT